MAEWLRRWTWNLMGFSRVGSNTARSGQEVLFIVTNFFENTLYVILALKNISKLKYVYHNISDDDHWNLTWSSVFFMCFLYAFDIRQTFFKVIEQHEWLD